MESTKSSSVPTYDRVSTCLELQQPRAKSLAPLTGIFSSSDFWILDIEIGASRPYASKDDLKGPELCPSHEIKHMSVLREAKLRLKEELDLSTIQRPFDLKYVPILHSTSISEEDRVKGLIQHRRREKRNALKPYYCFCCKSYPFGQVVSSEEDQIAHYDKDCEAARIFEEKVKEKMNEIRESEDFLKVIERKRKIQESMANMNSFNNKKAKEKSNIVCNIFHLPEFPKT